MPLVFVDHDTNTLVRVNNSHGDDSYPNGRLNYLAAKQRWHLYSDELKVWFFAVNMSENPDKIEFEIFEHRASKARCIPAADTAFGKLMVNQFNARYDGMRVVLDRDDSLVLFKLTYTEFF